MFLLHYEDQCITSRSRVSQPASAGEGAGMSELRAHYGMAPQQ